MEWGWRRSFKLEHYEVLGLDIGSSQVKLIELRKDESGYAVAAAAIADIEGGEDNNNRKEANTARAIRKCVESIGTQTRMAVCGVSGPEVAVRCFKFPSLPPEEIAGAVQLEAAQVCPFSADDGAVDYQLTPNGKDNVCGVLVAATNKLIQTKSQLAKGASLMCVLMDVDGLALLNCFNGFNRSEHDKQDTGQTTAILNVGNSYTTLSIMGNNGLPFIRDIAYGSNNIAEQIAKENNISIECARRILSNREDSAEPQLNVGDSLARASQKLIVDVAETLRYYTAQEKTAVIEKIFVCGGLALVKGFVELLDNKLPARAVLWNPLDKVHCDAGQTCKDILSKKGPAMTVAAGLAMRSV